MARGTAQPGRDADGHAPRRKRARDVDGNAEGREQAATRTVPRTNNRASGARSRGCRGLPRAESGGDVPDSHGDAARQRLRRPGRRCLRPRPLAEHGVEDGWRHLDSERAPDWCLPAPRLLRRADLLPGSGYQHRECWGARSIAREPCQHLACWTARADRQGAATGTCGPGAPQSSGEPPSPHPPPTSRTASRPLAARPSPVRGPPRARPRGSGGPRRAHGPRSRPRNRAHGRR